MGNFAKIVDAQKLWIIFAKRSILDVLQDSEYPLGENCKTCITLHYTITQTHVGLV